MIIISTPILKSDKTGSVDGTLIMGRFISEAFIKRLEETKSEPLSDKEWKIIRQHTEIEYRMAMATPDIAAIAESILSHHERWDGSGYSRGYC